MFVVSETEVAAIRTAFDRGGELSAAVARRACQGWPRLLRPPEGLGLDWPEHGRILNRIGAVGARHLAKFKPVVLRQIHAAGNTDPAQLGWRR
jgi:hypothetical protein